MSDHNKKKFTQTYKGISHTLYLHQWTALLAEDDLHLTEAVLAYRFARPEYYPDPFVPPLVKKTPDRYDIMLPIAKRFVYMKERFMTRYLKLIYLTEE